MAESENNIPPPAFALTAKLNQTLTDWKFKDFTDKYLPGYEVRVTSTLRTAEHNAEVGGADNSAHVHGLAVDFILLKGGKQIPVAEFQRVFDQVIAPKWPGFALFEGDHVHVNLSRTITPVMSLATFSVLGIVGVKVVKLLFSGGKK